MTKPKTKYPIESFDPRIMQTLLRAGRGETIVFKGKRRRLRRLQIRLHMLRQRMREENHDDWKLVYRARTSLRYEGGPNDPAILTVAPNDEEFDDLFGEAEVEAPTLSSESGAGDILDEV